MGHNGHKRKNNHVVIVTSDATDARMRQFRIRPWILQTIIIFQCIIIGALIGFFIYEKDVWTGRMEQEGLENETIKVLEQEKAELEAQMAGREEEIAELNDKIRLLSETVNQQAQAESALSEQLEKQTMPTEFPLTGKTTMEETSGTEENPICVFTASPGSMVVATATGTVTVVSEDPEYGNNIWIDHGNGYTTIYRNKGEVKVKQGEKVTQGATLFVITEDDSKLGYQVMKDGEYVDPMEVLAISG